MIIKSIYAENYRNIEKEKIYFSGGVNLLLGDNAQGKTNIIEAIYTFARGKSFRLANDKKLVRFGCDSYFTEIEFSDRRRDQTLSYLYRDNEKIRKKNGIREEKASDMIGVFRAVLFCPEHLMIVKGGPSERREFVNVAISQNDPMYIKDYVYYNKALENRNTIIKNAKAGLILNNNEIDVFSEQMAFYASKINRKRREYIGKLEKYAKECLYDLSGGKEELTLEYMPDVCGETEEKIRDGYIKTFYQNKDKEISAGVTLFGIHRDDIEIKINALSSRLYASQGQQRSVSLALKMAEGEVSREINGEYPVFLFDDVLSELDDKRQQYIINGIKDKQIIISACDKGLFDTESVNVISVTGGRYVSSHR